MAACQNHLIFTGPNATARLTAYVQSTQALLLIIHCKNAVDLSCGRRSRCPRIPQPDMRSRGLLGCSQGPLGKVLQIRGGHQDGHQLESLHFYGVPWPHRRGLKSSKKKPLKLTSFFSKKPFAKSRSIDGSNRCILRSDRKCVVRMLRKSQGAMTLPEIGPRLPRPRPTDFRRRRPWGAHFARSGNFETHPCRGSNTPMGRRPGE